MEKKVSVTLRLTTFLAFLVAMMVMPLRASAQTYTTLHDFCQVPTTCRDGAQSASSLVQGTDGNFYGATEYGGNNDFGTIFKITPSGAFTTLHRFSGIDGGHPAAGLIQATDGDYYGVTTYGGTYGLGTVFKITAAGKITTLANFDGADGSAPVGIIQASDSNFYGTTIGGGLFTCDRMSGPAGCGTIFQMTPNGTLTTLYQFCSQSRCHDGSVPYSGLVQGTNGNLYGTTSAGGNENACAYFYQGCGTVFEITLTGVLTTLHRFDPDFNSNAGAIPGALIQALDGNLYGTTGYYDAGEGAVFSINSSNQLKTVYTFCLIDGVRNCSAGYGPAGLIQATDGSFYGTTFGGEENEGGSIYRVTPAGKFTALYNFLLGTDANGPIQATDGDFYGTTYGGGANGNGMVYKLSLGLAPFIKTQTAFGSIGGRVKIVGTGMSGVTSLTFNGVEAKFTLASPSLILATIPSGATSGFVQAVTANGTLTSNSVFAVMQ